MFRGNGAIHGRWHTPDPRTVALGGPNGVPYNISMVSATAEPIGLQEIGNNSYTFTAKIGAFLVQAVLSLMEH
jgi:hypothetical protein